MLLVTSSRLIHVNLIIQESLNRNQKVEKSLVFLCQFSFFFKSETQIRIRLMAWFDQYSYVKTALI